MADGAEEDFSALPLPDRFQHKAWKVRKTAYEDAAKQFELTPDEHDPAFKPFLQDSSLWKGAVADSNVAAQQDGIAAFCAYLKFGGREGCVRARSHTLTPIVEKGLASTRAATKASSLEAILLLIELDVSAPVVDDLLPVLSNKQPKVVAATLAALTAIFHNYGCKTVDPKPVLKILPKAFSHADKNVRAEATNLAVEFYRWLREAMKPMFWSELKPTQQTDMETAFEKIKSEGAPKQERFLRSQQAAMSRAPAPGAAGAEEDVEGEDEPVEIDVHDLAEPQDVLAKVPATYTEALASSKWKERKEVLDELFTALNVPRIKDGDFGEVVRGLAKSMKDANVAVVTVAAQCIEVLAKGLRKPFSKYRQIVMQPIMERLKEKKASVSDALGAALDETFLATSLTECMEDIMEFLKHKNPQVKEGTMKFLIRCLRTTRTAPAKPEVLSIAEAGKKLLSESSEGLRSGGAEVLGTLMKIMGERAFGAHLEGLDDIRKTKIKEYFDTAVVKAKDKPKPPPPAAAPARVAAASAPAKKMIKKPATKKPPPPPSQYAQTAPAPLAPPSSAKGKLGALKPPGVGLKAPTKRTLAGPGGAAPPNVGTPRKAVVVSPPIEEDHAPPAAPRMGLGRGLTGRSLGRPTVAAPLPTQSAEPTSGLTALERAELEELRAEKDRLSRQNEDLRADRSRLNSEIQELKNQNAQLIEDHTRDMLTIKAKETQLVRARSDAEAAEAVSERLKREMERLKKALGSAERVGNMQSPGRVDSAQSGIYHDLATTSPSNGYGHEGPRVERRYGGGRNFSGLSDRLSEEKENGIDAIPDSYRSKLSPELTDYGLLSGGSGSAGRASPANAFRSERREASALGGSTADGGPQPVESWKRAAEVTSALKAKIEQMKARQGLTK